jgi:hypothetical protein
LKKKTKKPIKRKTVKTAKKKKTVKKTVSKKKENNLFLKIWLPLIIIVVIVVAILLTLPKAEMQESNEAKVIANVNGENIYETSFLEKKTQIPAGFESVYTEEVLLNQTIIEVLLLQMAEEKGAVATTEETKSTIEQNMAAKGMTMEQLMSQLEALGQSYDDFVEAGRKQLTIVKGLEATIPSNAIEVSEDEIETFYNSIDAGEQTLEELRDQIIEAIKGQKYQEKVNVLIQDLMEQAEIEVFMEFSEMAE